MAQHERPPAEDVWLKHGGEPADSHEASTPSAVHTDAQAPPHLLSSPSACGPLAAPASMIPVIRGKRSRCAARPAAYQNGASSARTAKCSIGPAIQAAAAQVRAGDSLIPGLCCSAGGLQPAPPGAALFRSSSCGVCRLTQPMSHAQLVSLGLREGRVGDAAGRVECQQQIAAIRGAPRFSLNFERRSRQSATRLGKSCAMTSGEGSSVLIYSWLAETI